LNHFKQIRELVENEQQAAKGIFKLGIIPTIAPYLVPEILEKQNRKYKDIELILKESTTNNLINDIQKGIVDGGLMAGPLNHPELLEYPLYYEKFYAYVSPVDEKYRGKEIDLDKIDINDVWLLENEHCLRGQIERLCQMKRKAAVGDFSIKYESGSIDTLIHIVDYNHGITIIPEMHAMGLPEDKQENLRAFKNTTAVREVSLVISKEYVRKTMLQLIIEIIQSAVPKSMQNPELKNYVVNL
jgi:LysR family hydrogen peroxide-inducible transcriptional activator